MSTLRAILLPSGRRLIIVARTPEHADELEAQLTGGPSLPQMAQHALAAAGRVVQAVAAGKPVLVSAEVNAERAKVCAGCPLWDAQARGGLGKCNHRKCGCTALKAGLATERCPLHKWPA